MAEMARVTPKPKARSMVVKKILDPEHMEMIDIEGPASDQITPGEASVLSDMYTAEMSLEEVNLRDVLLEPKKWKLDSLDDVYGMLDRYCELR